MSSKKIILVTGANSGIGYATSLALASASPDNHVIVGSRSQERGIKAVEEIRARNPAGTVSLLQLDITSDDAIKAAVDTLTAEFGVLDVLVNNAGTVITQPKDRRSELVDTFNINTASALILAESLAPLLKKSKDPRIINVTSWLGSISGRADPKSDTYEARGEAYRISKAALNMATAHLAYDFKSWGAKVWAYCPGFVATNLTDTIARPSDDFVTDSPETSAQGIVDIVEGKRDGMAGKFISRSGELYNW
ncbi:short chain dehydrogenase [Colletotrichum zoysiae]|uniref:Short chain dehydrogenase n=1 Tax=Colletotrichum zoysiae TaxID=1216348 RepID=A0AAD9H2J6_9PEZI|nr:short chain dehydrogenase [Colletotrichum zoysiae]